MRVWKCKQVIDFDQSTTTVKEERNKTLCWMNQISYYDPSRYTKENGITLALAQRMVMAGPIDLKAY